MDRDHAEQTITMTIRATADTDREAVERLAERDSATVPPEPLLGAEVDGLLVAVTSLTSGETIADPFHPTADARAILELRAAQLRSSNGSRRGRGLAIPIGRARASLAGSPPGAGGRLLTLRP